MKLQKKKGREAFFSCTGKTTHMAFVYIWCGSECLYTNLKVVGPKDQCQRARKTAIRVCGVVCANRRWWGTGTWTTGVGLKWSMDGGCWRWQLRRGTQKAGTEWLAILPGCGVTRMLREVGVDHQMLRFWVNGREQVEMQQQQAQLADDGIWRHGL